MKELERRLIVGGQNLLEKAEAQARLLERSAEELRAQEERTQDLRKKLKEKKEERFNIEEKYNSLQVRFYLRPLSPPVVCLDWLFLLTILLYL